MQFKALLRFWKAYKKLSPDIQRLADRNFRLLKEDPHHSSLKLKKLISNGEWSVRIGSSYRALGFDAGKKILLPGTGYRDTRRV